MKPRFLLLAGLCAGFVALVGSTSRAQPVRAAGVTIVVNTSADTTSDDGVCSLREAIISANTDTASGVAAGECAAGNGADVISITVTGAISYLSPMNGIGESLTIIGPGSNLLTLYANYVTSSNLLWGGPGQSYLLSRVRISSNGTPGGIIVSSGTFVMTDVVISGVGAPSALYISNGADVIVRNSALVDNDSPTGSGLYNAGGRFLVVSSVISGNFSNASLGGGGGIRNTGVGTILNTTIANNVAGSGSGTDGGGVSNSGELTIMNSTLSGNRADFSLGSDGGGLYNSGILTLTNSTVISNFAGGLGGGIRVVSGTVTLWNTIIAASTNGDCSQAGGAVTNNGFNLVEDNTCGFTGGSDPILGPLADNGGPTLTHALLLGSPAIDAGDPNYCAGATDQRGFFRLVDGNTDGNARCDIGAFEYNSFLFVPTGWVYLPLIRR